MTMKLVVLEFSGVLDAMCIPRAWSLPSQREHENQPRSQETTDAAPTKKKSHEMGNTNTEKERNGIEHMHFTFKTS